MRLIDLTGKRFANVEVIRRVPPRKNETRWLCRCLKCNREYERVSAGIETSIGCGCAMTTHGHTRGGGRSPTYMTWYGMRTRCTLITAADYPHYGGRGIGICDRWRDSFENFMADMGERPSKGHTLDRIDTTKGYSPENCRWATATQQMRNRIDTRFITFRGETRCIAEWAEIVGIDRYTLHKRLYQNGWTVERALTQPIKIQRSAKSC